MRAIAEIILFWLLVAICITAVIVTFAGCTAGLAIKEAL